MGAGVSGGGMGGRGRRGDMSVLEKRAYNKGLEDAAKEAEFYGDENFRLANDTIKIDPILNMRSTPETIDADTRLAEILAVDGHGYASAGHAGHNIATNIRARKLKSRA